MACRITRAELIEESEEGFAVLLALIERVPAKGMTGSSVNSAGWSLKDVLAHVAEWAERCEGWCRAGERGERPQAPAPGF